MRAVNEKEIALIMHETSLLMPCALYTWSFNPRVHEGVCETLYGRGGQNTARETILCGPPAVTKK